MRRGLRLCAAGAAGALALFVAGGVMAEPQTAPGTAQRQPVSMSLYRGACQSLMTPQGDYSEACAPALVSNLYSDGFVGYAFIHVDPATHAQTAISFLGGSAGMTPGKTEVQGVLLIDPDAGGHDLEARGTCTRSGADDGVQSINCEATTDDGMYTATFVSDGSKPQVRDMMKKPQ